MEKQKQLESQINLQKIIQSELNQLRRTSKVYKQQSNSDIFFLSSVEQEVNNSKQTLDKFELVYASMEKMDEPKQKKARLGNHHRHNPNPLLSRRSNQKDQACQSQHPQI